MISQKIKPVAVDVNGKLVDAELVVIETLTELKTESVMAKGYLASAKKSPKTEKMLKRIFKTEETVESDFEIGTDYSENKKLDEFEIPIGFPLESSMNIVQKVCDALGLVRI